MRQFVSTSRRQTGQLCDQPSDRYLVRWIARTKVSRDRKNCALGSMLKDRTASCVDLQRLVFIAIRQMATRDESISIGAQLLSDVELFVQAFFVSDEERADRRSMPLYDGVCCQRRG